jgi:hypothetical protein
MRKEIRDELENVAPNLLEIGNKNPYRVPALYFENLEKTLDDESKMSQQSIPSNYFENLADQVFIKAKKKNRTQIISLNAKRWVAAASIVIVCVASYITMNTNDITIDNQSFLLDEELEEAFDYLADQDDLYISEVLELSDVELFEGVEEEINEEDLDFLLDEVTLDDLDELL